MHVRPFVWGKDFKIILQIVQEVWFFDAPTKQVGYLNALNFMLHYLNLSTDIIVVVDEQDKAVGVLGLTDKKKRSFFKVLPF